MINRGPLHANQPSRQPVVPIAEPLERVGTRAGFGTHTDNTLKFEWFGLLDSKLERDVLSVVNNLALDTSDGGHVFGAWCHRL